MDSGIDSFEDLDIKAKLAETFGDYDNTDILSLHKRTENVILIPAKTKADFERDRIDLMVKFTDLIRLYESDLSYISNIVNGDESKYSEILQKVRSMSTHTQTINKLYRNTTVLIDTLIHHVD